MNDADFFDFMFFVIIMVFILAATMPGGKKDE
jgi:hypothetical protein